MSAVSYTHRLDPRTDANLTAAILAVGNLLGISPMAESIVGHLKDRIGDTLSPAQRLDPLSVYASDLLGRVVNYVKETYGLDQPANIHGAPRPGEERDGAQADLGSVFALDGLGRNRFERETGATGGEYVRRLAALGTSSAAYGALTERWNPTSGAAGLNEFNFATSPFAAANVGLDLATAKHLLGQGFTTPQVIAAGQDRLALGLSGRQSAENLAHIRRDNPQHITNLKHYRSDSLGDAAAYAEASQAAAQAEAAGNTEEANHFRRVMAEIEARQKAERERIAAEASDPQIQNRIRQVATDIWENNKNAVVEAGIDPKVVSAMREHPEDPEAVRAYREAYDAALEQDPGKEEELKALDDSLAADRELHGKVLAEVTEIATENADKEAQADSTIGVGSEDLDFFNEEDGAATVEPQAAGEPPVAEPTPAADQPADDATQPAPPPQEPAETPAKPKIGSNGLVAGPS